MKVAIKKFPRKEYSKEPVMLSHFLNELKIAHGLKHPNVILYMGLSLDTQKGNIYIVTELATRCSLYSLLHNQD